MYSRSYIQELLGQHGVEKGCPLCSKSGGVVLGPTNTKKGERGSGPKNMDCMRPIRTMLRLNYVCLTWCSPAFWPPWPICLLQPWMAVFSTFCAPKAGRLGTACWPIVFSLILRPSNLCFRCWTLRSSPCSGKWPLPSSHRRSACNRSRGGGTINARCTCRHPWQGHGLAWSSDWLSQNLPWEFLFAVSLFFLISKAARKMTCHATRDELHTKSKLRVMHVLKDEYCAQWFLLPIETFSTRGSKSLHPYTQHIPFCVWVLFRVPSWLLDSGFQKNRGINSPPQTSMILAWVSTHTIHVVHPDVYWLDGMFCSEWDVCFSTFWVLATTKSNPLRSWPCFFLWPKICNLRKQWTCRANSWDMCSLLVKMCCKDYCGGWACFFCSLMMCLATTWATWRWVRQETLLPCIPCQPWFVAEF